MGDGRVVIETGLDSSGIQSGLSKLGSITKKGLKATTATIAATATALAGVAVAAVKVGSDFESQMSRVKAISGATGEEFEKLKTQAIKLGAETAFSSKEAAEGMENLAAAGFTTNEIMDAMPGLLDLAAASGEDLSNSSDIAASTLRGFGLEAKDAAHVADVLAANANKTNSSVAQTGEAMKFVAPVARSMGLSLEETAAAIGIMANAGIQGSQAGTTLRGALSRLSKPTDVMQQAMDELGVSFYNSEGKMKSLTEQVAMMRKATEGMTDEQKNNYLVTLYGQEALSGMLALMNEGEGSLNELTEAYKNSDGEAKKAAETMRDNLKGSLDELGGAAESLGIVFYESVSNSLKDAAKTATESINNIIDAFNRGGLDAAIETAGNEFANLAVDVAKHAPDMVDAAVSFIESFARGIGKNKDKLLKAAGDTAKTLAGGLSSLLPKELQKPVDKAIEAISKSLGSGGLKQAGKTAATTFDNTIAAVGKLANVALPPLTKALDVAGNNLDVMAAAAAASFTAIKGYAVVTTASKAIGSLSATVAILTAAEQANTLQVLAASGALSTKEMIVGVLTGKITLATAAQALWNAIMAANPIGLVVTAVAALAAGLAVYKLATDKTATAEYELSTAQKKSIEKAEELHKAYKEMDSTRQEAVASVSSEYDHLSALNDELNGLIDSNGKVKEGYEDRANFIVNELSGALGLEKDQIWEIIHANGNLGDSIDQLISKKRAEALLNANEQAYTEALKQKDEALKTYQNSLSTYEDAQNKYNDTQAKANDVMETYNNLLGTSEKQAQKYLNENANIIAGNEAAKESYDKAKKALDKSEEAYVGYNATIQNYEGLSSAIISGDSKKIEDAMRNTEKSFITAETGTQNSLKKQVKSLEDNYDAMKKAVASGTPSVTQEMVDAAKNMVDSAKTELDKFESKAKESTSKAGEGAKKGFSSKIPEFKTAAKYGALAFAEGFNASDAEFFDSGEKASSKVNAGLGSQKANIEKTSDDIAKSSNDKLGSKDTKGTGSRKGAEYNTGVGSQKGNIDKTSDNIASSSDAKLGAKDTKGTGNRKAAEYNSGVGGQKGNIDKTSDAIASSSNSKLGSANTAGTGNQKGDEYNKGLSGTSGAIRGTSTWLADVANAGMGSANTGSTGASKSSEYNRGLGTADTYSTGWSQAINAKKGLGSVDASGTGDNFTQGFINGMSWGDVWSAAWDIGKKALSALSKAIKEGSPSRLTRKSGGFFGKGFGLGISDEKKAVEKSAENLGQTALDALDMSSVTSRMREAMAFNTNRVAKSFNLETSQNIIHRQESKAEVHLSDEDLRMMAKQFGLVASDALADNMEGMKFTAYDREVARVIRRANQS